jgi:hypothetical protein
MWRGARASGEDGRWWLTLYAPPRGIRPQLVGSRRIAGVFCAKVTGSLKRVDHRADRRSPLLLRDVLLDRASK